MNSIQKPRTPVEIALIREHEAKSPFERDSPLHASYMMRFYEKLDSNAPATPTVVWLSRYSWRDYANPTEPAKYPDRFVAFVPRKDYDALKARCEELQFCLDRINMRVMPGEVDSIDAMVKIIKEHHELEAERNKVAPGKVTCEDCNAILAKW